MVGIDLFAGAGGMSEGAKLAGLRVDTALEFDSHAVATYQTNHPEVKLVKADIRAVDKLPLSSRQDLIIFGGPPCQGFSTSNQRTRNQVNERNWLFRDFLRLAKKYKPQWIVFENVKGITETENGLFLSAVIEELEKCKYTVSSAVLNAVDYGIPQKRERLFVVGCRSKLAFEFPVPSADKPVTVRDAIADLPRLPNGANENIRSYRAKPSSPYAGIMRKGLTESTGHLVTRNAPYILERYKHVPMGGNWESIPRELMENYKNVENCHTGIYHRLDWGLPSLVIGNYRKNMLIHPVEHRGLSVREAARIQSFSDSYQFSGSIGFQQQQVGNAVPPLLAKAVFAQILKISQG